MYRKITINDVDIYGLQEKSKILVKEAITLNVPLMTLYCSRSPYNVDTYHKLFKNTGKLQLAIDKQREYVLNSYPFDKMSQQRCIKKNLSVDELNKLIRRMEEIFYPLNGEE